MRFNFMIENGANFFELIQIVKVCGVMGSLVFAVRALPARAPT